MAEVSKHVLARHDSLLVTKRLRKDVVDHPMRGPLVAAQRGAWIAVAVVIVGAVAVGVWMPGDRWGAIVGLFGTLGTLLAVAVAATAARHEAAMTASRARDEQAEREIQQARRVTAELNSPDLDDPQNSDDYDLGVRITNWSDALVFDPRLEGFTHPYGGETSWEIAEVPGYADYAGPPSVLKPGDHDGFPVTITHRPELRSGASGARIQPVIGFTDAGGRRWRRIGSSLPVRVLTDAESASAAAARTFRVSGPEWYRIDS